jgi:hypothetical protein
MSTEELDKYNALYARFLEEMVEMHNAHLTFIRRRGRETVFKVRRFHKKIISTQKELYKLTGKVYAEHRENTKERLANQREERKLKTNKKQNQNQQT